MNLPAFASAASAPQRVLRGETPWPVHDVAASRAHEAAALAATRAHRLMERAGTAVARVARAVAPHARSVWIVCGPGNNGDDGLVVARLLGNAGLAVHVTWLGDEQRQSDDARWALDAARQAGVRVSPAWPSDDCELVIDALLGLGSNRGLDGVLAQAVQRINRSPGIRLSIDLPTGLNADTGTLDGGGTVRATHTVALLTLKPGLFTAAGRDCAGEIWFDPLGVEAGATPSSIRLASRDDLRGAMPSRSHDSHKGRFGDVAVVGGSPGMTGAALLAARAALGAGAGRVLLHLLDDDAPRFDATRPELMFRDRSGLNDRDALSRTTVVCGCGGGSAVREWLPPVLACCPRLVLDADALNALAADEQLAIQLRSRSERALLTVLTPHPLEAARLLDCDARQVQADRLRAARTLAQRYRCAALLKGSGSITATPDGGCVINPTGNAWLAAGGTGDVLAGWIGGCWAQIAAAGASSAAQAAIASAWLHGHAAERASVAPAGGPALRAGDLIEWMRAGWR